MKQLVGIFLLTSIQLFSQEIYGNKIVVFGRGEISALANRGVITFSIKGTGPTLEKAGADARQKLTLIVLQLKKFNISEANLETAAFQMSENYSYKAFLSTKRDFQGAIAVDLTIDSLEILDSIVFALYSQKPEYVSDVKFSLKNQWKLN